MCDTIYFKRDGKTYFGKNSDRSPNEAHLMIRVPAKDYENGETLKTTYIEIPQAKHTYSCVLLKPHWIWGAEMGWNEFGLNIGNEAVFTNVKRTKQNGLIGMDLLRLAIERCKTPKEAITLITNLIETYGQVGNCGFDKKFYYDNAFLIANQNEAYVLETAGKNWVVKKTDNIETISNCLSITNNYDFASKNFNGNFKETFQNNLFTKVAGAETRRLTTKNILSGTNHPFNLLMNALKSHANKKVTVNKASTCSACMHAGNLFGDQTTGSYFGEINKMYFVTGSSFPCLSIFKPLSAKAEVLPKDEKQALNFWINRELVNRHILSGNIKLNNYLQKAKSLEEEFMKMALNAKNEEELETVSKQCFEKENNFVLSLLEENKNKKIKIKGSPYFKHYWNKKTKELKNAYKI